MFKIMQEITTNFSESQVHSFFLNIATTIFHVFFLQINHNTIFFYFHQRPIQQKQDRDMITEKCILNKTIQCKDLHIHFNYFKIE